MPSTASHRLSSVGRGWGCVALLLAGILSGRADLPFTFRAWTTHQGLPENQVTCLTQTRDGYLWVGTEDGLARFDGVRFVNFGLRDGLRSTRIRTLYEDREGNLWIGTIAGGLSRLRNGRLETFGAEHGLPDSTINQIAEDGAGRLWVAGRALVLVQDGRFISMELPDDLRSTSFTGLVRSRAGFLWLSGYQAGLWRFDGTNFSRETGPAVPAAAHLTCHRLWEDRAGRLWVCAGENQLFCRDTNGWQTYSIPLEPALPLLRSLAEEVDGTVWAGSIRNGLYYSQNGQLNRITTRDGLSEDGIESLLVDREGNIWVGTIGGGLNRLTRKKVRAFGTAEGLRYAVVRGMAEVAPGELWVGTRGDGLYHWQTGVFWRMEFAGELASEVFFNSIVRARDGTCWAATGHGIYQFVNGQPLPAPERSARFQHTANVALCEDREEGVWAGAGAILWHLRTSRDEVHPLINPRRQIISIAQGQDGAVWVGTEGDGLYHAIHNEVRRYQQSDGLGSDQVRVLRFDREGTLWIGTASGGLTRLKEGRFFTAGMRHGLPDDTISQIIEDDAGHLWVGCNRGIARIRKEDIENLSTGQIQTLFPTVLTAADGLPSEECTGTYSPAGLRLSSGELCFATLKGIVLVDPRQEWQASPPPEVWLEEVLVNGEDWDLQANRPATLLAPGPPVSIHSKTITLPPGRHRVAFHYTGLNFTAPSQVRFRYQLEGLDPDWVPAGNERTAYYNYIPPGNYTFRVIACNKDGVWNERGASLALSVQPFLWQRAWFSATGSLLAIVLVAGAIAFIQRRRHERERARIEALHVIETERTRIAKDIHDDLGATLSAIRLLSKFGQAPEMPEARLREDMRQIAAKALESTQSLDEIVWAVDPHADSLESFVNYACAFATEQLALADVRCRLDLPEQIPAMSLQADVRHNLFLAFKEVITNVLKHAAATEVHVKMEIGAHALDVTVTDNGRGMPLRPPSVPDTGHHGIPNLHDRLQKIGGHCELQHRPGQGVMVRLRIPL